MHKIWWWWSSGQYGRLQLWQSELESWERVQIFFSKCSLKRVKLNKKDTRIKPENIYHMRSITVQLTSWLTGLDSTKQVELMLIHHKKQLNTNKINRRSAVQWYFALSKCSLVQLIFRKIPKSKALTYVHFWQCRQ